LGEDRRAVARASTSFGDNSDKRKDNLMPATYSFFSSGYPKSKQDYPTSYTTAGDVVEAVYAAATDNGGKLRYPSGDNSVMLSLLRQSLSEQAFMARMQLLFGMASHEKINFKASGFDNYLGWIQCALVLNCDGAYRHSNIGVKLVLALG
jgi:hypothetical protein